MSIGCIGGPLGISFSRNETGGVDIGELRSLSIELSLLFDLLKFSGSSCPDKFFSSME